MGRDARRRQKEWCMERVLRFEGDGAQDKFDKVWEGFTFGTRLDQQRRQSQGAPDKELQRRRASLARKLKGMTVESKRIIAGNVAYRDLVDECELVLDQQELALLVKTMEETEWLPEHLDVAFGIIDWVDAADKR